VRENAFLACGLAALGVGSRLWLGAEFFRYYALGRPHSAYRTRHRNPEEPAGLLTPLLVELAGDDHVADVQRLIDTPGDAREDIRVAPKCSSG
jgi:hypothetical protein